MTEARVGYHKEVKTASFQGKSITVENLTPMLSPKARDKRKREIESCLYSALSSASTMPPLLSRPFQ